MKDDIYIQGQRVPLDPTTMALGQGGEAEVFRLPNGQVLKIYKRPDHPDFAGDSLAQTAAEARIAEHQRKLRAFPKTLPSTVVAPIDLAMDKSGVRIIGYTMPFLKGDELIRFTQHSFRTGMPNGRIRPIFQNLHQTVNGIHQTAVIGDFNDLNVIVVDETPYLVDADAFQFSQFFCRMFTDRFVDPQLCDPTAARLLLTKPHTANSDWYAYAVMLFQCLLFVDPYGGIYRPKDPKKALPQTARALHRITVFHPEVRYPKPAMPFKILPDDLLEQFHRIFEKDERGTFPLGLIDHLEWRTCSRCGLEHTRPRCPDCAEAPPAAIKQTVSVRGTVTATRIFRTHGVILRAAWQSNTLRWLIHENDSFRREDGSEILRGPLLHGVRYRIRGAATLLGKDATLAILEPDKPPRSQTVDCVHTLPIFATNETHAFWARDGRLERDDAIAPAHIGNVLAGNTLLWVGPTFGFGFYRAGDIFVAFVFDALRRGINDSVPFSRLRCQLVDAVAVFSTERVWVLTATQEGGRIVHRCTVVTRDGRVLGTAEADAGDGSWLSQIRGSCTTGHILFHPTDDGIVKIEVENGTIIPTKKFPDTEPFVNGTSTLFPHQHGIAVVGRQEIVVLKLN